MDILAYASMMVCVVSLIGTAIEWTTENKDSYRYALSSTLIELIPLILLIIFTNLWCAIFLIGCYIGNHLFKTRPYTGLIAFMPTFTFTAVGFFIHGYIDSTIVFDCSVFTGVLIVSGLFVSLFLPTDASLTKVRLMGVFYGIFGVLPLLLCFRATDYPPFAFLLLSNAIWLAAVTIPCKWILVLSDLAYIAGMTLIPYGLLSLG